MERDQLARMHFYTPLAGAALVDTVAEVMAIPIPANPQQSGFILVIFNDCGANDVVLSSVGLSLGADTKAFDDITLECGTYDTPAVLFPFNPSNHGNFTTNTVTLTFTPTAAVALGAAPLAIAVVGIFPVDGMKPVTATGTQIAVES